MPIKTTCIGAFPKPDYVPIKDWFKVIPFDDCHCHSDLTQFGKLTKAVALATRMRAALTLLPPRPDCGLSHLTLEQTRANLGNKCKAAVMGSGRIFIVFQGPLIGGVGSLSVCSQASLCGRTLVCLIILIYAIAASLWNCRGT